MLQSLGSGTTMEHAVIFSCLLVWAVLQTVHSYYNPPDIKFPNKPMTDYIPFNSTHVLTCVAEGSPDPKYRWIFNGGDVSQNANVNATTGNLTITGFTSEQEGNYQCLAENEHSPKVTAVAASAVITLKIASLGEEWPVSTLTNIEVNVGEYVNMTCDNSPNSVPEAEFSWYVGGSKVVASDRISTDAKGTLHFIYVEKGDENQYHCSIFNTVLNKTINGTKKSLVVKGSDKPEDIPKTQAQSRFYTNPAIFPRTKTAELECIFSGNPIPKITWYDKGGKTIQNGQKFEITESTRKLIIKNLQEEDMGKYTCNSAAVAEEVIFLNVTSGPIWVESLRSQTVEETHDAVFKCHARPAAGDSKLKPPEWYRNGDLTTPLKNDEKFHFSNDSRVLTVKNLNISADFMCFQCNVSNSYGYEFASGCLNVTTSGVPITGHDPESSKFWIYIGVALVVLIIIVAVIVIVVIVRKRKTKKADLPPSATYSSVPKSEPMSENVP